MKITIVPKFLGLENNGIKKLVPMIVKDYCENFGVTVKRPAPLTVVFTMDDLPTQGKVVPALHVSFSQDNECIIYINMGFIGEEPEYGLEVLCHEVVHYCQYITRRHQARKDVPYNYQPAEIEAIGLQAYYAGMFMDKYGDL